MRNRVHLDLQLEFRWRETLAVQNITTLQGRRECIDDALFDIDAWCYIVYRQTSRLVFPNTHPERKPKLDTLPARWPGRSWRPGRHDRRICSAATFLCGLVISELYNMLCNYLHRLYHLVPVLQPIVSFKFRNPKYQCRLRVKLERKPEAVLYSFFVEPSIACTENA